MALRICLRFAVADLPFALYVGYIEDFTFFLIGFWLLMFLGACLVPTCYGIMVSCVPRQYQSASSAFGQIFFNIFGYFAAPIVSGYVIDTFEDPLAGLQWGFRAILWSNILAVAFLIAALCVATSKERRREAKEARRQQRRAQEGESRNLVVKPEESQTSSMSHTSNFVDYSKQELREEV